MSLLKKSDPDLHVWGFGGPALEQVGTELLYNAKDLTVMGIIGVLKFLPILKEVRAHLLKEISERNPDAILLVDYGGFNLNLAKNIRKTNAQIPIIYFISPQVWGSRPWRIKAIARNVSKMLVIFPFEESLYRGKGVPSEFVGHPLTDRYADEVVAEDLDDFRKKYNLDAAKPLIGIFPGSRKQEITSFMPILLQAISWLHSERSEVQFAISQANPTIAELIYTSMDKAGKIKHAGNLIKFVNAEDNRFLMESSDVLWTKSGTITLEGAFMEKPMLVYYRGDWLSYFIFMLFKRVKYVAWPNLLAGKMVIPELIQLDCRAEQLVRYTRDLLDVPAARTYIAEQLRIVKSYLNKGDYAANAAEHLREYTH